MDSREEPRASWPGAAFLARPRTGSSTPAQLSSAACLFCAGCVRSSLPQPRPCLEVGLGSPFTQQRSALRPCARVSSASSQTKCRWAGLPWLLEGGHPPSTRWPTPQVEVFVPGRPRPGRVGVHPSMVPTRPTGHAGFAECTGALLAALLSQLMEGGFPSCAARRAESVQSCVTATTTHIC